MKPVTMRFWRGNYSRRETEYETTGYHVPRKDDLVTYPGRASATVLLVKWNLEDDTADIYVR